MAMTAKLIVVAALAGAAAVPPAPLDQPGYEAPARPWAGIEKPSRELECHTRIQQARAAAGQPQVDPRRASPADPVLHYAVDRRVDGCGVLVPVGDPGGMVPPPLPGPPVIIKAQPGR